MCTFFKVCHNKKRGEIRSTERDSTQEMEALQALVQQLEKWREETESDLTISHRMTDKMKQEKQAIADEKRILVRYFLKLTVFRNRNICMACHTSVLYHMIWFIQTDDHDHEKASAIMNEPCNMTFCTTWCLRHFCTCFIRWWIL